MSDFLPPWLQDLDEPDEPKSKPSAPPPPPPAQDADDGIAIPPWLMDVDDKPKEFIKATGEFSDDFLAAGDDLPETSAGSVTYDEWRRIQHEKQRERSIEEEVPDLLNDELPNVPFPEGTMKLPDTGELPDWFLGLEELDDSQAPDWFTKPSPRGTTPLPPEPTPAAPPETLQQVTPLPAPVTISPDLFAAVMQPDFNDEPPTTPASSARTSEADFGFEFDEPDLTDYVEPTVMSRGTLSMAEMMSPPVVPPSPPMPPEPAAEPVSDVDMSWLNEINSIVGNVIQSDQGEDEDTARYTVTPPVTDYLGTDKRSTASSLVESSTPDWLSQIEAMPDQLEQEQSSAAPDKDAARPIVDFSEFDFSNFDTAEPATSDPFAGMFDNIAAVQTGEQKQVPTEPQPPKRRTDGSTVILPEDGPVSQLPAESLSFDFDVEPANVLSDELERLISLKTGELDDALFADEPPAPPEAPKRKTAEELDRLAQMRTDEVEALFEFEDLMQPSAPPPVVPPAPPKPNFVPIPVVDEDSMSSIEAIVPLLPFDDSPIPPPKPLRKKPAAAAPVVPPVQPEENMSWLSSVRFEEDAPTPPSPPDPVNVMQEANGDDAMHALFTGLLSASPEDARYNINTYDGESAPAVPDMSADEIEVDAFARLFGEQQPSLITDEPAPRETYAPATPDTPPGEPMPEDDALFRALFGDGDVSAEVQNIAPPQTDDLSGLLNALGAVPSASPENSAEMQGFIANTGELDALFGEDQDDAIDDRSFVPGTAELNARFGNLFAQENAMPANDDFDKLFADMDDESAQEPSDELPGTGSLSGYDSQAVAPGDDDLTALFSAFEEEHRQPSSDETGLGSQFDDDDSFFAALGLDREPPEGGGDAPPKQPGDEDPWDFSEPEVSKTTYTSGTGETSMWEDEAEASLTGSAGTSVFDFDAAPTDWAEEDTFEPYVSDWAEDDAPPATTPPPAPPVAFDNTPLFRDWEVPAELAAPKPPTAPLPAPVSPPVAAEPLPDWLGAIDMQGAIDDTQRVPGGMSAIDDTSSWLNAADTPEPDLDSYLAGLGDLDAVLPPGADLSRPISSTAEYDLDQMFDQQLQVPDAPLSEGVSDAEPLARADLLDELQASVGAVSAVAIARQMQDRSEAELDDRLKRLRKRGTAEVPAAPATAAPEDNVSSVLPGLSDALTPAPVVVDTPNLVGDAQLTETQRERLAVAQDLTGTTVDAEGRITQTQDAVAVGEAAPIRTTLPMTVVTAPAAPARKKRLYRIDRLLVSLALLLGVGLPFFVQEARIGALPPTTFAAGGSQEAVFEQVDQLDEFDLVLVGLDYGPSAAAELDPMTDALVRHVLLRGARPIFISGNPFGVLRAQSFIDRINADSAFLERINQSQPLEANIEYYAARFLPGSAVGLRAFSEATAALLTVDINAQTRGLNLESLANIALIMLITDRAEDVRAYAEQIAPLATRPLVAAVNYGSAPLAQPYVSEALSGLLVGYSDALTYAALLPGVEAVERGPRPILPQDAETPESAPEGEATPDAQATPGAESTEEAQATATPEAEPQLIATVTSANGANVRSGPGTDFDVIAGLRRNAAVIVLEVTDDWVRVQLDDGREGWVSAGLVVISEATPSASSSLPGAFLRPLLQSDDDAPVEIGANDALRWYAMNMGIIIIVAIIVLGSLIGLIRGILRRRAGS
jgi:hypothetical protein